MLFPKDLEGQFNFSIIRQKFNDACYGSAGQVYVDKIKFSSSHEQLTQLHSQTSEFISILKEEYSFPYEGFHDLFTVLNKSKIAGSFLDADELFTIKLSLHTIFKISDFFKKTDPENYLELKKLAQKINVSKEILKRLELTFDDAGNISDNASPELRKIRREIISQSSNLRKTVFQSLKKAVAANFADQEWQPTLRNGRMVIPVKSEKKRLINGLIHDESATGQTTYIEPTEAFSFNNKLKELHSQEKREIIRILVELSALIREELVELQEANKVLCMLDFIRAKARIAIEWDAGKPQILNKPALNWQRAYHPILLMKAKSNKEIVPLNIELNDKERILLISGPNAGGKSVALKTVGLLQYMFQCGLPVPVESQSTFGIFRKIMIDIGDQQSLENELSTYSAHLTNMKFFIDHADKNSLCLIDEFGTGTEPDYGGAIAESILYNLNQKQIYGVITTHYANLKEFAEKTESIANGAMLFDIKELEPLYKLEVGKPGSSFALEIAKKSGIPEILIQSAIKKVGKSRVNYDKSIKEIESEQIHLHRKTKSLENKQVKLDELTKEYEDIKEYLENKKKFIINEARLQAAEILKETNRQSEILIKEIRENAANKEKITIAKNKIETAKLKLVVSEPLADPDNFTETEGVSVIRGSMKVGDEVRIKESGSIGNIESIKGNNALVSMGQMTVNVKLAKLEKVQLAPSYAKKHAPKSSTKFDFIDQNNSFNAEIDLRGKRTEDALNEVDKLLDKATIIGSSELRILHGKGNGILRTMIRNHLEGYPEVIKTESEHIERGGDGVTLVYLK